MSDLPTYVFASVVLFSAAFTVSLRSFIGSDLWYSVKECYADLESSEQLLLDVAQSSFRYSRQLPCRGYVATFFNSIETQKLSLLVCRSLVRRDRDSDR